MPNKLEHSRSEWIWDCCASYGYNVLAKFESTLINLGIMEDFSDIEDTERFDMEWSLVPRGARDEKEKWKVRWGHSNKAYSRD